MGLKQEIVALYIGYVETRRAWEEEVAVVTRLSDIDEEEKAALLSDYKAAIESVHSMMADRSAHVVQAAISQAEIDEGIGAILGDAARQPELSKKLKALAEAVSRLYVSVSDKPWTDAATIGADVLEPELQGWNDDLSAFHMVH